MQRATDPPVARLRTRGLAAVRRRPPALAIALAVGSAVGLLGGDPARRVGPLDDTDPLVVTAEPPPPAPVPAPPPAFAEPFFPFLDDEPSGGSVSVGTTSHGWIVNARPISESAALGILPRQRERGLDHGSQELVSLLEEAARALHGASKTRLWVGNVGRRGGGDISWSVSHNSGRDADVAFCYRDAAGQPVDPPDLVPLDREGWSKDRKLRFDPDRTWLVVRSMLESGAADVQYLFMSHPLKVQLLAAARRQGASAALVERANVVVRQPGGAHPHDDHLHVRVYCSERDLGGGCVDEGAVHAFIDRPSGARERRIAEVSERLVDPAPEQRRRAILRLGLLGAKERIDAIALHVADEAAAVRAAAAEVVGRLGEERHVPALIAAFDQETDGRVIGPLAGSIAELGGPAAGSFLFRRIADPSGGGGVLFGAVDAALRVAQAPLLLSTQPLRDHALPPLMALAVEAPDTAFDPEAPLGAIRLAAIQAAARADCLEPVPALVPLLGAEAAPLRNEAASALAFITNRPFEPGAERLAEAWGELERMKGQSRGAWLVAGFARAGYRVGSLDQRAIWELVRAIGGDAHVAYNATRTLVNIAGEGEESLAWTRAARCRHWLRYFDARRADFSLSRPPPRTQRTCWDLKAESG